MSIGNLTYRRTIGKEFESRETALEWIILNQFGRRNSPAYDRARLVLKLEYVFANKGLNNMLSGKTFSRNHEKVNTDKELAKIAGLGNNTIRKVKTIVKKASQETKEKRKV